MKMLTTAAAAIVLSMSAAFAGGPVVVVEEGQPEVIKEAPSSSVGILPLLLGIVILCAVACGNDDDPAPVDGFGAG